MKVDYRLPALSGFAVAGFLLVATDRTHALGNVVGALGALLLGVLLSILLYLRRRG
jgi:hypothetical protein